MVDVVITTYQRPKLTLEAIESVLNQSLTDLQCFVVEDGSNALNEALLPNDTRLTFTRLNKNLGPSYGRNFGASLGSNPFIAFLDSDDLWHVDKLKKQVDHLSKSHEFYIHTNETWLRNGQVVKQKGRHRKQGGYFIERLFERCLISPSSVMFRRDFWHNHGKFLEHFRVAEDYELWLRLNYQFAIAYLEEPLTIKRAGSWYQLSSSIDLDHFRVLALHRFYRLYQNQKNFSTIYPAFKKHFLKKIEILLKGSQKYGHEKKVQRYKTWLNVAQRI